MATSLREFKKSKFTIQNWISNYKYNINYKPSYLTITNSSIFFQFTLNRQFIFIFRCRLKGKKQEKFTWLKLDVNWISWIILEKLVFPRNVIFRWDMKLRILAPHQRPLWSSKIINFVTLSSYCQKRMDCVESKIPYFYYSNVYWPPKVQNRPNRFSDETRIPFFSLVILVACIPSLPGS